MTGSRKDGATAPSVPVVAKEIQDLISRLRAVQHGAYNAYASSVAQEAADTLAALSAQPAVAVPDGWRPISEADREITHQQHFPDIDLTIRNSDRYWVRDADGRVYEASWTQDGKGRDYWWDWEGESPVDPVEFMPHPLDPRFTAAPQPAPQPVAVEVPEELCGVPDVLEEGRGMWRTCTGCHEVFEGHPVGEYPYSKVMKCDLGSGCFECGGIGAIWDTTDYEEMGRHLAQDCDTPPADLRDENERLKAQLNMATDELTDVASILSCLDEFRPTIDSINATIRAIEESAALKGGEK